ncbi:origin recognition complex subunit 2-like isoform X2 [Corticium candelabrum]|uniref:origin recognition complex subunit 2-like isoform X2 n=1 Tax=Corticium candelabrum TaxID=121492 RepID=UPI002E26121F|nr:origin recognition complex subunit 2-like isoform X2 [Corticium candelabrum]
MHYANSRITIRPKMKRTRRAKYEEETTKGQKVASDDTTDDSDSLSSVDSFPVEDSMLARSLNEFTPSIADSFTIPKETASTISQQHEGNCGKDAIMTRSKTGTRQNQQRSGKMATQEGVFSKPKAAKKGKRRKPRLLIKKTAVQSAQDGVGTSKEVAKEQRLRKSRKSTSKVSVKEQDSVADSLDELESGSDCEVSKVTSTIARKLNGTAGNEAFLEMDEDLLTAYFTSHTSSKVHGTSDNTLDKLSIPRLDRQTVSASLASVLSHYEKEKAALLDTYSCLFDQWMLQLQNGFSIIVFGFGSKRSVLDQFRKEKLQDKHIHVVVNGYFPDLTLKEVLCQVSLGLLQKSLPYSNPMAYCQKIKDTVQNSKVLQHLFLLIHNIDGPRLRTNKVQTVLSLLAALPFIHLIASLDHVNGPLLWNQVTADRFNWLCDQSYTVTSVKHVLDSLTPNARSIFLLLCRYQLEHVKDSFYIGWSFNALYKACRENFLVNTDVTLRSQLTEFRDHKLIQSKKGPDGAEMLYVSVAQSVVKQVVDDFQ